MQVPTSLLLSCKWRLLWSWGKSSEEGRQWLAGSRAVSWGSTPPSFPHQIEWPEPKSQAQSPSH